MRIINRNTISKAYTKLVTKRRKLSFETHLKPVLFIFVKLVIGLLETGLVTKNKFYVLGFKAGAEPYSLLEKLGNILVIVFFFQLQL